MSHVPATVIVGAQWGDEGKGKIVDLLAQDSDLVCRYQGGPNAGHTIVVGGETYKIRAVPSGIITGKACAIGAGCVVDPQVLIAELDELESRGLPTAGLVFLSGNAHLIMPWQSPSTARASASSATCRSARPGVGSARPMPTRRRASAFASRTCSTPRSCARRSSSRSRRRTSGSTVSTRSHRSSSRRSHTPTRGRATPPPVHRRHLAPRRSSPSRRRPRPLRGCPGDAARSRPRDVPVRHLLEPDRRRGGRQLRDRPEPDRRDPRRLEGVRDARRGRPVPVRDRGGGTGARPRAGRRVRHRDRARAAVWLARPAGPSLCGAGQRDHLARADEAHVLSTFAEIPVCVRYRAAGRDARPRTSPRTRVTSTIAGRCGRHVPGWECGAHGDATSGRGCGAMCDSSRRHSTFPSLSSAPGQGREAVLALR